MCTLSLFRGAKGYQVFMNRDERHDRIPELRPKVICDQHGIFGPLDPESGGTWIAYNQKGYWGCLLNGYFEDELDASINYSSRGEILPEVLSQEDPLSYVRGINPACYPSFRLLVGSADSHLLLVWDGQEYRETAFHSSHDDRAFFLSSSSWRQDAVIEIRKELFQRWIAQNPERDEGIPGFHYSEEPDPETAPLMTRSYSGTKSITTMRIGTDDIEMSYWQVSGGVSDLPCVIGAIDATPVSMEVY